MQYICFTTRCEHEDTNSSIIVVNRWRIRKNVEMTNTNERKNDEHENDVEVTNTKRM